jgi:hypothetical protein
MAAGVLSAPFSPAPFSTPSALLSPPGSGPWVEPEAFTPQATRALTVDLVGIPRPVSPASCQSSALDLLEDAAGGAPSVGGNLGRLSEPELATGHRLAQRLGQAIRVSDHEGAEFVSAAGRTYDALGTPAAYRFWNERAFLASIDRHLRKSNNFTVIDLTGANTAQIAAIRRHVNSLESELQNRILYVGQ